MSEKANGNEALRYLRHEGLYVDAVILSHLDEDHAGSLKELMDSEIQVKKVILPAGLDENEACGTVLDGLNAAKKPELRLLKQVRASSLKSWKYRWKCWHRENGKRKAIMIIHLCFMPKSRALHFC